MNTRRFRDRDDRRKKKRLRGADCDLPDCDVLDCDVLDCDVPGCDGCGDCDLPLLVLITALVGYFATPPVREGKRLSRPGLRLIRSYQRHVSAHRPAVCNLSPTCSKFGYETLRDRGWRGLPQVRARLRACRSAGRFV